MKSIKNLVAIPILSIFLYSCSAPTEITSWKDLAFGKAKLKKILVLALIKDMEFRKTYEDKMTTMLVSKGISAASGFKLLELNERISKKELDKLLNDGKYDGLLMLKYESTKKTKTYFPGTTYYDYFIGGLNIVSLPGYFESHKTVIMESILFSVNKKKAVWAAETRTKDAVNAHDLAKSLSEEIIDSLMEDGII